MAPVQGWDSFKWVKPRLVSKGVYQSIQYHDYITVVSMANTTK
jgi:hypothetical protein